MPASDIDRFADSCLHADEFPRNLVHHDTYEHNLLNYVDRLDEREDKLFLQEGYASLDLLEYDSHSRSRQSVVRRSTKELKDHTYSTKTDCRFVFLHAPNSRERLYTSRTMLTWILTYHQVMPAFLDFIFSFGRQEHARDLYFSGFREESNLTSALGSMELPEIGRSGREVRICYNLKSVEPSEVHPHMPWSIRQTAVYHSLDVKTGKQFWVVVKGDELIKYRIEDIINSNGGLSDVVDRSPAEKAFASSLATHIIISDWCSENWRWYISFLEESLREKTGRTLAVMVEAPEISKISKSVTWNEKSSSPTEKRPSRSFSNLVGKSFSRTSTKVEENLTTEPESILASPPPPPPPPAPPSRSSTGFDKSTPENANAFSFNSLQQVQLVEDKANEVALILDSSISVLTKLQDHYENVSKSALCPQNCTFELQTFQKRISSIINDLRMQNSRTTALLRLLADRKNLLYGILQFQNMEASKILATRAQESTENMETMTKDMHTLALRTKQETVSMRVITLVTLFFLPGTFISTIMSTDIIKFEIDDSGHSQKVFHLDALQLFMMIALPLMLSTFAAWYGVYWWIDRKEETKRRSELFGSEKV